MSEFFLDNMIWVILYPLWIFLIICTARFFAFRLSKGIISALTLIGSGLGIICSLGALPAVFSNPITQEVEFSFIKINDFILKIGVSIDKLSIIFLILLFTVSFFVHLYSTSYIKKEPKYYRFFAYLNLFNFGMSGLLAAPNLFQTYIFWEIIGLVSYLFIGFKYQNPLKSIASLKVFLINRVGDVAFLSGIICLIYIMTNYTTAQFVTLGYSDFNFISAITYAHTNEVTFLILCILLFIGAAIKSAQLPFHTWLLAAMEAATPVSALIHSATLVTAGTFLTFRLFPLFSMSADIMSIIATLGIFTAIFCSLCAICQTNVKKVLAYSTSANLGLVFATIGFGNLDLALIFLIVHGLTKAALFLSYGANNNEYQQNNDTKLSPSFVFGAFILSGLLFAGFNTKEMIFETFKGNFLFSLEFLIVTLLSTIYIFRICALYPFNKSKETPIQELISIWCLFGILIILSLGIKSTGIGLPFIIAIIGAILTVIITKANKKECTGIVYRTISEGFFIDYIYTKVLPIVYSKMCFYLYKIDFFISNNNILKSVARLLVNIAGWIDKNIFDITGKATAYSIRFASKELESAQTKNVQTYIAYAVLIISSILVTILLTYALILRHLGGLE